MYTHVTLVLAVSDITYACYEHVLDCVCFNVPTADSPNPLNVWGHGLYAILIRNVRLPNVCTKWKRTANIILCSWLLSTKRVKHGYSLLVRGATPEYPAFTLIILILLAQIGTWRRVLFSLPKGAGHGHSLVTGAVFRPANQELQYYRSSEDAEFSKVPFSKQKTYCNVLLQKNGAWHRPVIAVFTQRFQSWRRYTTETGSTTVKQLLLTGNLWSIQQRNLRCGGNSTIETALPNKVKRLHCGMRCSAPPKLISNWLACSNYNSAVEPAGLLDLQISRGGPWNYRGITLPSTIYKLLEKVMLSRFRAYGITTKIHPLQGGFRPGYSCLHTAFIFQETISHLREQKKKVYVALLDVKKAFDTVWHAGLFHKIQEAGISGQALNFIRQWYDNSMCSVLWNDQPSRTISISQGVKQGGVLSPLLCSLYVNDLLVELENSGLGARLGNIYLGAPMYADDLAMIATSPEELQGMLDIV